jgi:HSP20 family protein
MVVERWRPTRRPSPWRMFQELEEAGRHFDSIFGPAFLPAIWRRLPTEEKEWAPALEVLEKEDRFIVRAELPGIKEDGIEISVNDGNLTLKGEKKTEHEAREEHYRWTERTYGSFHRTISLTSAVDTEKIGATYEDGVLEIDLPKIAEVKPKKITVATGKKKEKTEK